MKVLRVTNGFSEMSDAYLPVRAEFIVASMNGNPHFPAPVPTLAEMTTTIKDFRAAMDKAQTGNRLAASAKNQLKELLVNKLHLLGSYVLFAAAGNEVAASSSGFQVAKAAQPLPPLAKPGGLVLREGLNKGDLKLKMQRVKGARAYLYEITPSPVTADSHWRGTLSTITVCTFTGLESGREYNCRVAAVGKNQQVVYSDVVSRIAL